MNQTSYQQLVDYYQSQWYTIFVNHALKILIGIMQVVITYVTLLACIKMFILIYNQLQYDRYKQKWVKEVVAYEDETVINETNEKYKKIIIKYYDRLEKYDQRHVGKLYTYPFMFIVIIIFNSVWLMFPYTRTTYLYGLILFILYQVYQYFKKNILEPIQKEREIEKERRRLDQEIARQKKEN